MSGRSIPVVWNLKRLGDGAFLIQIIRKTRQNVNCISKTFAMFSEHSECVQGKHAFPGKFILDRENQERDQGLIVIFPESF